MPKKLEGKVALVTGASRGIGKAIALRLAEDGADVVISYASSAPKAEAVAAEIKAKGVRGEAIKADSAHADEVAALVKGVAARFGRLDILINSAGVYAGGVTGDSAVDVSALDRQLAINLVSHVVAVRTAAPLMTEGGRIISIGSNLAERVGFSGVTDYSATKAGSRPWAKGHHCQRRQPRSHRYRHESRQHGLRRDAQSVDRAGPVRQARGNRRRRGLPRQPRRLVYHGRGAERRRRHQRMISRRTMLIAGAFVSCRKTTSMEEIAERYVKLVLALGKHDADYVDAYYGPPAWKDERKLSLDEIRAEGAAIIAALTPATEELRHRYLFTQTKSVTARAEMLAGKRFSFDEESRALYDAVAPKVGPAQFEEILTRLEKLIPGKGPLGERYETWRKQFYIPPRRLAEVFQVAIDEARTRTKRHIDLPANENFVVEYVTKQVWSAYNWYKGNAQSLIQVNTDLPTEAKFALHLACHEGYPGHHVYNALLEDRLVRKRGWIEYTVYPLYSPQSLIAEGSADYGVELTFPGEERAEFLASRIFPPAGLDTAKARVYLEVAKSVDELDHAGNYAARRYIDKEISSEECRKFLEKYALMSPERAAQRVRFIDKNRSYVINYNVGEDLIRAHMKASGNTWAEFEALLSSPRLPSGLRV